MLKNYSLDMEIIPILNNKPIRLILEENTYNKINLMLNEHKDKIQVGLMQMIFGYSEIIDVIRSITWKFMDIEDETTVKNTYIYIINPNKTFNFVIEVYEQEDIQNLILMIPDGFLWKPLIDQRTIQEIQKFLDDLIDEIKEINNNNSNRLN